MSVGRSERPDAATLMIQLITTGLVGVQSFYKTALLNLFQDDDEIIR
jgi:hypothetical protein